MTSENDENFGEKNRRAVNLVVPGAILGSFAIEDSCKSCVCNVNALLIRIVLLAHKNACRLAGVGWQTFAVGRSFLLALA